MVALCGAEPVHPATLDRFVERFGQVGLRPEALTPVYGLAEATLAVTFTDLSTLLPGFQVVVKASRKIRCFEPMDGGYEWVSVGKPLPNLSVKICEDGMVLEEGRVGRVWAHGPGIMQGYLDDPEATSKILVDGWLDTGDEGFLWDGELYLTGRAKDLIILRGRNHDPAVIEQARCYRRLTIGL